jgi:predicted AlkP superfamily pyrophosphatase or phosphodiesterase
MMIRILLILLMIANISGRCLGQDATKPYVVMLSLDGFRWDYTEKYYTPNLRKLAAGGVKTKSLIPCFPTKTFPNHYSIVTGLYPDNHGIVQNSFYDSTLMQTFEIGKRATVENGKFYAGEPIWLTATKQGMLSASFFWVGSEAAIQGLRPDYWKKYEQKFPYEQRIDTVIHWLSLPEKLRPHLITWYMDEPDGTGHRFGPVNDKTKQKVEHLDSLVGVFVAKIMKLPIADKINIIIVSDHGMGGVRKENFVKLCEYLKPSWYIKYLGDNPVTMVQPAKGCEDSLVNALKNVPHIKVWRKKDIPKRLNYGGNSRIFEITIAADSAWGVTWRDREVKYDGGTHGYDNENTDMHGIFIASGPAFKQNFIVPSFENIHIYSLLAKILELKPVSTDGNLEKVVNLLK